MTTRCLRIMSLMNDKESKRSIGSGAQNRKISLPASQLKKCSNIQHTDAVSTKEEVGGAAIDSPHKEDEAAGAASTHVSDAELGVLKTITQLMQDSATLQPPSYLIPWERSTYIVNKTSFPLGDFPSSRILKMNSSNAVESNNVEGNCDIQNTEYTHLSSTDRLLCSGPSEKTVSDRPTAKEDDLLLSESEEDPFACSNDSDDPDYAPKSKKNVLRDRNQNSEDTDNSSATDSQSECVKTKKNTRKRQRNPSKWRRNEIKRLRNLGERYEDWKGNVHPKRQPKNACHNCRQKCQEKFTEEERKQIFENYWQLGDVNRQRDFIARHVDMTEKARTRPRRQNEINSEDETDNTGSKQRHKEFSFKYTLYNRGQKVVVCKTFFLNTLGISAQVVKTVFQKMGSTGIIAEDRRGKVCKNSKLSDSVKQSVRDHINLFETVESHYCRKNTSKQFLPPTLNVSKMYSLYLEYCEQHDITAATESIYRLIFNSEFNFSFFIPKKDLCDICNKYDEATAEEKQEWEEEYQMHRRNKDSGRELKNLDKEKSKSESELCAAVFDLEQILPVPKSNVGLTYYKLKLSSYNFTVFDLANSEGYCYMWYESIAKRGSSEIGSCLMRFIEHKVHQGTKRFTFYSDNCAGQNRNRFIFSLYNFLAQKHSIVIRHTFLEKGHTQTEGDSMHSVIERASRHVPIFTPDQWYTLVRTAKRTKPFKVTEMDTQDFFDLKALATDTTLNWDRDESNEKIIISKIRMLEADYKLPNKIQFKYDYHEPFKTVDLLTKGRRKIDVDINKIEINQCYTDTLPITKKKYDHLQFLCSRKAIPIRYHDFYRNLPYSSARNEDSD